MPDVAVTPSDHFNTVLYSGNGSARTISGVGFQPDWNWTKPTNNSGSHVLTDAVRGNTKFLESNSTGAEQTTSSGITAFNSDGYTLGTGNDWNVNSDTFVSWNWKANGSGSSNTNGSITSTVSANVDAGFSIVTYTGNATEGATVGHGLSKAPEVMLVKKRSGAAGWYMYHKDLGPTKNIELQVTSAASTTSNIWNDTAPTSSVFSLGNNAAINGTGATFVAYCFHSVDGYSKIGSYSGNGSTDGTFIYTGFRPAYVQWKKSSDSGTIWQIFGYAGQAGSTAQSNPLDRYVSANSGGSEGDYDFVDFLSNGFKLRHNSGHANTDSQTYIYIAFAETPLKNSNAR